MPVKIVTDSGSDISPQEAQKLGIALVPVYINFGEKTYRDGVDLNVDEFYDKLSKSSVHPTTAAPSPGDFAIAYKQLSKESNQILSIHITKRHSVLIDSALLGKEIAGQNGCEIEIMDSYGLTIWQGLVVIAAARAAATGCTFQQVIQTARETIDSLRGLALLDTIKYAVKGGRLAGTILKVESLMNVKPLLTIRNGEIKIAGLVRNWPKGIERLQSFMRIIKSNKIGDIAIAYTTPLKDGQNFAEYVAKLSPNIIPTIARMGPTLGVHTGPGTIAVAIVTKTI